MSNRGRQIVNNTVVRAKGGGIKSSYKMHWRNPLFPIGTAEIADEYLKKKVRETRVTAECSRGQGYDFIVGAAAIYDRSQRGR